MKYAVVYASKTGNTKLLAEALRPLIPQEDLVYFGMPAPEALDADRIYIGFWTDKGTCDGETAAFLKTVRNQGVYLFGTAGFGGCQEYYDQVLGRVQENLDAGVTVLGTYMCQGRMPMAVREKFERLLAANSPIPDLDKKIQNFDKALSHPDQVDLENFRAAVQSIL